MSLVANERLKLFATFMNGIAIAVFAVGGLAPLFSVLYGSTAQTSVSFVAVISGICFLASAGLHFIGSFVLKGLKQ